MAMAASNTEQTNQISPTRFRKQNYSQSVTTFDQIFIKGSQVDDESNPSSSSRLESSGWRFIWNFLLSLYSTFFSGVWFILSIWQPRYGKFIHPGSVIVQSTTSTAIALFAKTIEASFVGVYITFLGQVLTRHSMQSRGVTLADMAMRNWLTQPGYILIQFTNLRHRGITVLGGMSILASITTLLYTTASDTLVSPHLGDGPWEKGQLQSQVVGAFGTLDLLAQNCKNTILNRLDYSDVGNSCIEMTTLDISLRALNLFIETWDSFTDRIGSQLYRPYPVSIILPYLAYEADGTWIETMYSNPTKAFHDHGRIVDNITLAMPHGAVAQAPHDSTNKLLSPQDYSGLGDYEVHASAVSPASNVLCVNAGKSELAPLVYTEWPFARLAEPSDTPTIIPMGVTPVQTWEDDVQLSIGQEYLNGTSLDDIFLWGPKYNRMPPVFSSWPIDQTSIINLTVPESDSIYIMFKSLKMLDYTLCQIRMFLSTRCSTLYYETGAWSWLYNNCEDNSDDMIYENNTITTDNLGPQNDTCWGSTQDKVASRNVLGMWASVLRLDEGNGIGDQGSQELNPLPRVLSELIQDIPDKGPPAINTSSPSIAEGLSALLAPLLVSSSVNSTTNLCSPVNASNAGYPHSITFPMKKRSKQYTSGGSTAWRRAFYGVLGSMFALNLVCLAYLVFVSRAKLVKDCTEPQNAFILAMNSPLGEKLEDTIGIGPQGKQVAIGWHLRHDENDRYHFSDEATVVHGKTDEILLGERPVDRVGDQAGMGHLNYVYE